MACACVEKGGRGARLYIVAKGCRFGKSHIWKPPKIKGRRKKERKEREMGRWMGDGWARLEDTSSVHLSGNGFQQNTPPLRENVLRGKIEKEIKEIDFLGL